MEPYERLEPDPVVACEGCGGIHGSVGAEFNCLRASLRLARADAKQARDLLRVSTARHQHQATPR